ncbi:N-chimaerin [Smittium mucronatum]|uniref:N-chimaerin n=1 Tax=Smittium mucronatum TaxID=133383 RepID=A0A1R0GVY5_9FUNG|nr:N-chimaerin [Smittium mucronatum]OLY82351.1 N-chimaerin [Smittium mucronatum]
MPDLKTRSDSLVNSVVSDNPILSRHPSNAALRAPQKPVDQELISPQCSGCQKVIEKGNAIQFADGVWHLECFKCTSCKKLINFDSNLLFLADGKPICSDCSYSCSLCKKQIFDEAIVTVLTFLYPICFQFRLSSTAEGTYHSECFRCGQCKEKIQGKSFAKTNAGVIYCVPCYNQRKERKKLAQIKQLEKNKRKKDLPKLPSDKDIEPLTSSPNFDDEKLNFNKEALSLVYSDAKKKPALNKLVISHPFISSETPKADKLDPSPTSKLNSSTQDSPIEGRQIDTNPIRTKPSDESKFNIPPIIDTSNFFNSEPISGPDFSPFSPASQAPNFLAGIVNPPSLSELEKSSLPTEITESFIRDDSSIQFDDSYADLPLNKTKQNNSNGISKKVEAFLGVSNNHAFTFINTLRPVRCDKCNDLIWGLNSKELRCRVCGYTCHQKCFPGATSYCVIPSNFKKDYQTIPNLSGNSSDLTALNITPNSASHHPSPEDESDPGNFNNKPILDDLFKRPLEMQVKIEQDPDHIPILVKSCIEYIELNGINMEGIYRISGSSSDIKCIHNNILKVVKSRNNYLNKLYAKSSNRGEPVENRIDFRESCDFSSIFSTKELDIDVSSVTSVLKQYFRGLPVPLLTLEYYNEWINIFNNKDISNNKNISKRSPPDSVSDAEFIKIKRIREIGSKLPISHMNTLTYLLRHLKKVGNNSSRNLMPAANLSMVFAPNLLRLPESQFNQEMQHMSYINMCITFLINKVDVIWPLDPKDDPLSSTLPSLKDSNQEIRNINDDISPKKSSGSSSPNSLESSNNTKPISTSTPLKTSTLAMLNTRKLSSGMRNLDINTQPLSGSLSNRSSPEDTLLKHKFKTNNEGLMVNRSAYSRDPYSSYQESSLSNNIRSNPKKSNQKLANVNLPIFTQIDGTNLENIKANSKIDGHPRNRININNERIHPHTQKLEPPITNQINRMY